MVYIGGSRLIQAVDDKSDYDINFIVADDCQYLSLFGSSHLVINQNHIHSYVIPLNALEQSGIGYATNLVKQYNFSWKDIIWVKNDTFADTYIALSKQLAYCGLLKMCELYSLHKTYKGNYSLLYGANCFLGMKYTTQEIINYKHNPNKDLSFITCKILQSGDNWKVLWESIYNKLLYVANQI